MRPGPNQTTSLVAGDISLRQKRKNEITPALITSTIFSFMWRWDDFLSALLYINESAKYPVSLALKLFCDPGSSSDYGAMFAMATLSIMPAMIMFFCLQKYLVEGISTSGLKG